MGWLLFVLLLLAVLCGSDGDGVIIRYVSERDLERQARARAIVGLAMIGAGALLALVLAVPAWIWRATWPSAALSVAMLQPARVTVAGYMIADVLLVLVLAGVMFAVLDKRNKRR